MTAETIRHAIECHFGALVLVAAAVGLRLALVGAGWPSLNSDEGTMGLMARHIAYQGRHPAFFYGQPYMGSLEAYLGAGAFRLFGPSVVTLRLGTIALSSLFLLSTYLLTSLLYDERLALLVLALLGLGSAEMLSRQLVATGGRLETMLFGSLTLLMASWLALSYGGLGQQEGQRSLAYGAWGLTAGVSLWSDLLVAPFVGAAGALLGLCCWRELRARALLPLLLGLLVGASPLIAHNVIAAPGEDSWHVLRHLGRTGGTGAIVLVSPGQRLAGTLLVSLPGATGGNTLCPATPRAVEPAAPPPQVPLDRCAVARGGWGLGYLLLWAAAAFLALRACWRLWHHPPSVVEPSVAHRALARQYARLAVLSGATLTLTLFVASAAPARDPWNNTRYLVGLLIAAPALLFPIREAATGDASTTGRRALPARAAARAGLVFVAGTLLFGVVGTVRAVPEARRTNREQQQLIDELVAHDATRIYSEYWTCNRLMFQSRERIICAALEGDLSPGFDRYAPYPALVHEAPAPAYVFPLDSPQAAAFAPRATGGGRSYRSAIVAGYMVYLPAGVAAIPATPAP